MRHRTLPRHRNSAPSPVEAIFYGPQRWQITREVDADGLTFYLPRRWPKGVTPSDPNTPGSYRSEYGKPCHTLYGARMRLAHNRRLQRRGLLS